MWGKVRQLHALYTKAVLIFFLIWFIRTLTWISFNIQYTNAKNNWASVCYIATNYTNIKVGGASEYKFRIEW